MPSLSIGQSKCAVKQGPVWPNDLDSRTLSEGSTPLKILRDIYKFVKKHCVTYSTIGKNEYYVSVSIWNWDEKGWS